MTTMNISLPEKLKNFVDAKVQEQGYSTSSEYVRTLIRDDQIKQAEQKLAAQIKEGLQSGRPLPAGQAYWKKKQAALKKKRSRP